MPARSRAASKVMYHRTEAVEGRPRAPLTARWVAIIDDHRSVRSCLTRVMRLEGIHARVFASAEEYLDHQAPTAPCCLVLDMQLPGMSGYMLAQLLDRERPPLPPTIFISTRKSQKAIRDRRPAGTREATAVNARGPNSHAFGLGLVQTGFSGSLSRSMMRPSRITSDSFRML
jgi:CheY-like chemotaxis protein